VIFELSGRYIFSIHILSNFKNDDMKVI